MADDSEDEMQESYDIREARSTAHRLRIGLDIHTQQTDRLQHNHLHKRQQNLVDFIRTTFRAKECSRFVPKTPASAKNEELCHCGASSADHILPGDHSPGRSLHSQSINRHRPSVYDVQAAMDDASDKDQEVVSSDQLVVPEIVTQRLAESLKRRANKVSPKAEQIVLAMTEASKIAEVGRIPNVPFGTGPAPDDSLHLLTSNPAQSQKTAWDAKTDIRDFSTNAFGKIEFTNDEAAGKPAKYVRVSDDVCVDDVLRLFVDQWKMSSPAVPSLTISVIGGAKNFKLDGRKRTIFNEGLVKAARSTNAWIITSGCYAGVMRAVGEAVGEAQTLNLSKHRVTHDLRCIGIAPWGYILNRHELISETGMGLWPATYHADPVPHHGHPISLEPHHTHFVLVDDGGRNTLRPNFQIVADFRAKLEQRIAQHKDDTNECQSHIGIPVVVVLVEGGLDSIDFAEESIKCRIPLVVCKGTGRAADILAFAFQSHKTLISFRDVNGDRYLPAADRAQLTNLLIKAYGAKDTMDSKIQKIIRCCLDETLITIFDISSGKDFDLVILSALFNGKGARLYDQVRLALKWNRADVAAEKLLKNGAVLADHELSTLFTEALVEDKFPFINLLIQNGLMVKDYLSVDKLRLLYNSTRPGSFLWKLLTEVSGQRHHFFLCDVKKVLELLLETSFEPTYQLDAVEVKRLGGASNKREREILQSLAPMISQALFPKPYRELFIWALLMNRPELAMFFWKRCQSPVMDALVATKLYERLSKLLGKDNHELRTHFLHWKSEFQQLAMAVLNTAFALDTEKALIIAERPHPHCSHMNCEQIAASANDKKFIATQCCQMSLDQTWHRGMRPRSIAEVGLGILFPAYVLLVLRFDTGVLGDEALSCLDKLKIFYAAPVTKFCLNLMSHMLFLLLYTFIVMFDLRFERISYIEWLLHAWVLSFFVNEARETFLGAYDRHLTSEEANAYKNYRRVSFWKQLESVSLVTHSIGFTFRLLCLKFLTCDYMDTIRVVFCISVSFFYLQLFRFYMFSSYLGPKLFVIRKMFLDTFMFIIVLVVFMLAYAVAAQALLYPNRSFYWGIFRDILYYPYWQMYGELNLESTIQGMRDGCDAGLTVNARGEQCPRSFWPVSLMLAAYLLVSNILLTNLLIATFTHVFEEAQSNSNDIWKFEMWSLATEFDHMPSWPPPLSIAENLYMIVRWTYFKIKTKTRKRRDTQRERRGGAAGRATKIEQTHKDSLYLTPKQFEHLQIFEKECMMDYLKSVEESKTAEIKNRVVVLDKKVEKIMKLHDETNRAWNDHLRSLQAESASNRTKNDAARTLNRLMGDIESRLHMLERLSTSSTNPAETSSLS